MKYFDVILGKNDYVTGGDFTAADITLFAGLAFADFAKVDIPTGCENLKAWRAKVAARLNIAS